MSYKSKSVAIVDNGLFFEIARTLARSFGKVYYTSPWVSDYPTSYHTELGEGFAEIEHVDHIWEIIDDVDLFVFPDIYQGPLQEYLAGLGKRVWGSRNGDEIELYRVDAKKHFKELGIPQGPFEIVKGMSSLRKYIKSRGDEKLWVKISRTRGDTETFSSEGYDLIKNRLDRLQAELGPVAEFREFVVEDDLPETCDLAIDTFCIDGEFPSVALLGNEQKDEGYVGVVKPWADMPAELVNIYEKLSPSLKKFQFRNFFASEVRVGKGEAYMTDPCCRAGSPIMELELNMISNLAEILWEGAVGVLINPVYVGKYGYEVLVYSEWVDKNPLRLDVPEKYREQVKVRYATQFPDGLWIMPQNAGPLFGAIVAHGNSLEDCFAEAQEIAGQIKGIQVDSFTGSMEGLKKNLESLEASGIHF